MEQQAHNILITGLPGVGKTTLIKKISSQVRHFHPVGFYTAEIREKAERVGFELIDLQDRHEILSHVSIRSPHRVGRYGVNVRGFETFLESIPFFDPLSDIIILDEIGKMEICSQKFKSLLPELLDSGKVLIATIALHGGGFIGEIKKRKDVLLFTMIMENRNSLQQEILKMLPRHPAQQNPAESG
jgi:nucleoside-triphosphatase